MRGHRSEMPGVLRTRYRAFQLDPGCGHFKFKMSLILLHAIHNNKKTPRYHHSIERLRCQIQTSSVEKILMTASYIYWVSFPTNLLSCTGTRRLNHAWSVGPNPMSKLAILRSCTSSDLRRRRRASCTSCVSWGVANLRGNSNQDDISGYEVCTHTLAGLMHGFSSGQVDIDTSTRNVPVGQRWTTNADKLE